MKNFGNNLSKARSKANLTQSELAARIGGLMTPARISAYETGIKNNPTFNTIHMFVRALGCTHDDLFLETLEAFEPEMPDTAKEKAPWPDWVGNPIYEGDIIIHPLGGQGIVVTTEDKEDADKWRVNYGDNILSRLCLQIGEKGQATVKPII